MEEECSVDPPDAECCRRNNLVFVPDSNASNIDERVILREWFRGIVSDYIHAKDNQ